MSCWFFGFLGVVVLGDFDSGVGFFGGVFFLNLGMVFVLFLVFEVVKFIELDFCGFIFRFFYGLVLGVGKWEFLVFCLSI